ncbi:uncharacterized protein LOC143920225 [Arctopsyche grandis]|uniref:uncharacterized protein LOC143920225 n=1 Tax=Arctopsyche grandis TaxID=121162 RepID=UPI00406D80A2
MVSDSSDEDDERLREAIDVTLFKNDMYTPSHKDSTEKKNDNLKSNRHLSTENQTRDVRVSSDMQQRIGEKISKIINKSVDFVDVIDEPKSESNSPDEDSIKLFSDSLYAISDEFPKETIRIQPRKKIKKRKIDDSEDCNEKNAIIAASVSPDYILQQNETKFWKSRRKPKLYNYAKCKNSNKLQLIES